MLLPCEELLCLDRVLVGRKASKQYKFLTEFNEIFCRYVPVAWWKFNVCFKIVQFECIKHEVTFHSTLWHMQHYFLLLRSLYEIIHIWTADVDESEEWSSQLIFQFKQLERRSLKKIRASTGFEPVTSGSNPVEALMGLIFFRLLLSNCLNWKINCDDHSSLSSTSAVQI